MDSCLFSDASPASPPIIVCDGFTLLHTTVLSVTGVGGLWPGSPWTGLWFLSPPWVMLSWWWACTGVCFWLLETYPGCAACSASSALLTNSSLSVWTNSSVCSKTGEVKIDKEMGKLRCGESKRERERGSFWYRWGLSHCRGVADWSKYSGLFTEKVKRNK